MSTPWFVTAEFNTEADGTPVAEDAEEWPVCHYGPFPDEPAAIHFMTDVYPDGDTDVHDMWAHTTAEDLGVVNPPETVLGTEGPIGVWTQGVQP